LVFELLSALAAAWAAANEDAFAVVVALVDA
jgi:hypothetical protein